MKFTPSGGLQQVGNTTQLTGSLQPTDLGGTLVFDVSDSTSEDDPGTFLSLSFNGLAAGAYFDQSSPLTGPGAVGVYAGYGVNDGVVGSAFTDFSAAAELPSTAVASLPFTDNFNRSNSGFPGEYWSVQQGGMEISNNQLVSAASGDTNVSSAILNGVTATDTEVSADVNLANTGLEGWAGVASRVTDSSAYIARLRRNYVEGYAAELILVDNGIWITLDSTIVTATSGTIRLETIGSSIQMYLNETLVATATDSTLTSGGVGVFANDAGVTFDNFSASVAAAATPQNATLPFTDNFSRSGSSLLGAYWTNTGGDLAISDDQVTSEDQVTNGVAGMSSATVNGISAGNVMLTADIDLLGGDFDGSGIGLDARISSDGSMRYRGEIVGQYGNFTAEILRENEDGSWTLLNPGSGNFVAGTGTLRFELLGSSLNLYLNGLPVATATDSTYTSGGVGMMMNGGSVPISLTLGDFNAVVEATPPTAQNTSLPFSDNFNRSDNSSISPYWTTTQGVMAVGQDQLLTLVDGTSESVLNGVSEANVSIVGNVNMNLGSSEVGFDARISGDNSYRGEISLSFGTYYAQIEKEVSGVWTILDSRAIVWPLVNGRPSGMGTGMLRFDLNGSQIGLYLNDLLVASVDDSSITAAGTVGVNANGAASIDNFSATQFVAAAPTNATLSFDDSFTRPDNTVVVGPSWIEQSGDMAVQSNQLVNMANGNSLLTLAGINQGNVIVSAQVNDPAGQAIGLAARYSGANSGSFYYGSLSTSSDGTTTTAHIGIDVDGTPTDFTNTFSAASSGTLRFEVVAQQLQLFLNNVLLLTTTDPTLTSGSAGVWSSGTGDSAATQASLTDFDAREPLSIQNSVLAISTDSPSGVDFWMPGLPLTNILTGDVNGDGRSDAIGWDPTTGNWLVGLSQGVSGFTTQTWGNWSTSTSWTNVMTGDFNGDGLTDIVGQNPTTGTWYVAQSTGTSFTTSAWGTWNPSDSYGQVEVGDFNGDGRSDLAAWDITTSTWVVALSTGTSFVTTTWGQGTPGATWAAVAVGDFNGDGRSDLAALNGTTGAWHVELSSGTSFADSVWATWSSSVTWSSIHAVDLNGDGLTDLIGQAPGSTSWQVALSTGSAFTDQSWGTEAANLTNEQVGDFNGDGKTDIAGQVIGTNQWRVEESTGTGFSDQYWITTSAAISIQGIVSGDIASLNQAAAKDFETVYNTIRYQPYAGEMKGPEATQQTGEGNDWDQAALLVQLLNQSGIQTQYVSGVIDVPSAEVVNWLGARDTDAAVGILNAAGQDATILNSGLSNEEIQFNHVWVEAYLPGPTGLQWQSMDPSFKFQYLQAGIQNLSTLVHFDEQDYLYPTVTGAPVLTELPSQYYKDQIAAYLAANDPTQSLADVSYSGQIIARQFTAVPTSLPYTVVSSAAPTATVPEIKQARVEIQLQDYLFGISSVRLLVE
jgi:hypothetical protein